MKFFITAGPVPEFSTHKPTTSPEPVSQTKDSFGITERRSCLCVDIIVSTVSSKARIGTSADVLLLSTFHMPPILGIFIAGRPRSALVFNAKSIGPEQLPRRPGLPALNIAHVDHRIADRVCCGCRRLSDWDDVALPSLILRIGGSCHVAERRTQKTCVPPILRRPRRASCPSPRRGSRGVSTLKSDDVAR